jgi:hypothetical protein
MSGTRQSLRIRFICAFVKTACGLTRPCNLEAELTYIADWGGERVSPLSTLHTVIPKLQGTTR